MKKILKNKKFIIIGSIILGIILLTLFFLLFIPKKVEKTNTPNNNQTETETLTVRFDSNGGSKIDSIKIKNGETLTEPLAPTRDGYTFVEWTLDDKKYDFTQTITKDIILKATWEKQETTTKKAETTASSIKTTTKTPNNTSKLDSTIDKINLNENISVIQHTTVVNDIYSYAFISNLNDIFGAVNNIIYEDFKCNKNNLIIDTTKETQAVSILNSIKNKNILGISEFKCSDEDNLISYQYKYLTVADSNYYKNISNGLKNAKSKMDSEINNALTGSTKVLVGGAGGDDYAELLTEDLCNAYHLTCSRW